VQFIQHKDNKYKANAIYFIYLQQICCKLSKIHYSTHGQAQKVNCFLMEIKMTTKREHILSLMNEQINFTAEMEGDCISISNDEGVDAFLVVGEQQIIVESILFSIDAVKDAGALDHAILRTHHLVPLSTIAISTIGDEEYYVGFGALSVDSKDEVIVEEVEALFSNVPEFLELYSEHLK